MNIYSEAIGSLGLDRLISRFAARVDGRHFAVYLQVELEVCLMYCEKYTEYTGGSVLFFIVIVFWN